MLSRSVSGYVIEGWKGCWEEGEGEWMARTTPPPRLLFPLLPSWNRALRAAPKWLPAWLNVVKNGRALPPNLTGIFLYKKAGEESDESNFSASYNSKLSAWLNRGCDFSHDLLFVSRSILGFKKRGHFFLLFPRRIYIARELVQYLNAV